MYVFINRICMLLLSVFSLYLIFLFADHDLSSSSRLTSQLAPVQCAAMVSGVRGWANTDVCLFI